MDHPSVESAVQELHEIYRAGKTRRKRFKTISRILTCCTLGVFVAFLGAIYGKANTMYALEKFQDPVQQKAQVILKQLAPNLETLLKEAGPTYARLAVEKFNEALPTLRADSQRELERLATTLSAHAEGQLNATLERIAEKQQKMLQAEFPSLTSDQKTQALQDKWRSTIEEDTRTIIREFQTRYSRDVALLRNSFEEFDTSRFDGMEKDALMRYFAHLWLMRLDRLVLAGDIGGKFDNE
ncbi:MAG: hypothetical protein O7H41_19420 [Planctomycetota bacterium]|nr:hypothetical protein [Planctomycetota bacterium]